jgi:hypothetical protein
MFGLAMIVILISIGFLIYMSFRSQSKADSPQQEFTNDKSANDFVLSILQVSIDGCSKYTVQDLVIDCARDKKIFCNSVNSCIKLNETVTILLQKTFMQTNTRFRFYSEGIVYNDAEIFDMSYRNCTSKSPRQGTTGTAIIALYPEPRNVYLDMNICY